MQACSWAQYAILRTDLAIFRLPSFPAIGIVCAEALGGRCWSEPRGSQPAPIIPRIVRWASSQAFVHKLRRASAMKIDGGCHCGYVTIEAEADPETTTICNCT